MKHPKYSFASLICRTFFITFFLFVSSCADEIDMKSAGENDAEIDEFCIPLVVRSFDNPVTRIPTEEGFTTKFNTGDAIGIFAVKGIGTASGAIADGISNVKLRYSKGADGVSGVWTPENAEIELYYTPDVYYITYYPYKEGIVIDPTKTADAITTSFMTKKELEPSINQSTPELYTACDLMTAHGQATDSSEPSQKMLTLTFTHRYSLLELKTKKATSTTFVAPKQKFGYRPQLAVEEDTEASNVLINGVQACKMADGVFRAILKPVSGSVTVKGNYITSCMPDATIGYEGSLKSGLEAGKMHKWTTTITMPETGALVERALKPGDFVFQNNGMIEIYAGDGPVDADGMIPDYGNAIGMVVTCDPARLTDDKYEHWENAYVMGLENTEGNLKWGLKVDENSLLNTLLSSGAENNMNGYSETSDMLSAHYGSLADYGAFNAINNYRSNNPVPSGVKRSEWFIPSVGQWFDVMANIGGLSPKDFKESSSTNWRSDIKQSAEIWDKINGQLGKVNKSLYNEDYNGFSTLLFWCSSEATCTDMHWCSWGAILTSSSVSLGESLKDYGGRYYYVRPFFAF